MGDTTVKNPPWADPVIEPAGQDANRTHNQKSQGRGTGNDCPRPAEFGLKFFKKYTVSKHGPDTNGLDGESGRDDIVPVKIA